VPSRVETERSSSTVCVEENRGKVFDSLRGSSSTNESHRPLVVDRNASAQSNLNLVEEGIKNIEAAMSAIKDKSTLQSTLEAFKEQHEIFKMFLEQESLETQVIELAKEGQRLIQALKEVLHHHTSENVRAPLIAVLDKMAAFYEPFTHCNQELRQFTPSL